MKNQFLIKIFLFFFLVPFFFLQGTLETEAEYQKKKETRLQFCQVANACCRELLVQLKQAIPEEWGLIYNLIDDRVDEKIEELNVDFTVKHRATVEEARALYAFLANKIVELVQSHKKIQPLLLEQPFTHERLAIRIRFKTKHGPITDGYVSDLQNVSKWVNNDNSNKIFYRTHDAFTGRCIYLLEESCEEAFKLAANSPQPTKYEPSEKEDLIDDAMYRFGSGIYYELGVDSSEIGGKMLGNIEELAGSFQALGPVTQPWARKLIVAIAERFLSEYQKDERIHPYLAENPLSSKHVKIKLEFKDKNRQDIRENSVDHAILTDDEITYYYTSVAPVNEAINYKADSLFTKETYQEASKKAKEYSWDDLKSKSEKKIDKASSIISMLFDWIYQWIAWLFAKLSN